MSDPLIDRLWCEPHRFALFQALFLIQQVHPEAAPLGSNNPQDEPVRVGNVASLSFPAGQIESVTREEVNGRTRYRLSTSLMGLYGTNSPLPISYTSSLVSFVEEGLTDRRRRREFLDIFNHRLLSLAFRTEMQRLIHRHEKKIGSDELDSFSGAVMAMLGTYAEGRRAHVDSWLYASLDRDRLLVVAPRSASGLREWLSSHFSGIRINIVEFSEQWVEIPTPELAGLGDGGCRLAGGERPGGTPLGNRIRDFETKFRIAVGPVTWESFLSFLPSRHGFEKLIALTNLFVRDWLTFDIHLSLCAADCSHLQVVLDGQTSQLGFTTGLFEEAGADEDLKLVLDPMHAARQSGERI